MLARDKHVKCIFLGSFPITKWHICTCPLNILRQCLSFSLPWISLCHWEKWRFKKNLTKQKCWVSELVYKDIIVHTSWGLMHCRMLSVASLDAACQMPEAYSFLTSWIKVIVGANKIYSGRMFSGGRVGRMSLRCHSEGCLPQVAVWPNREDVN